MSSRTIAISAEVYARLKALKKPDESFSALLGRLSGRPSLMQLVGTLTKEQVSGVRQTVEAGRARSQTRRERTMIGRGRKKGKTLRLEATARRIRRQHEELFRELAKL